jgi:CRP-like cAMP-binding protein
MTLALRSDPIENRHAEIHTENIKSGENTKKGGYVGTPDSPKGNHLLASLSTAAYDELLVHLEHVLLPYGWVVHEPGARLDYVYFPVTSIVSLVYIMENGASAEIAIVGNEGLVGIMSMLGGGTTPNWAMVEVRGCAYRMSADRLKQMFMRNDALQHALLHYVQALMIQTAQIAVCNRHHSVEQQLCRWLLMHVDRLPSDELFMTQEQIAHMLGVRREGITEAAGKLQSSGIIRYRRGRILIVDRSQLERRTCECYAVMKKEYNRLLVAPIESPHAA